MESGLVSVDRWTSWSQAYFLTHMHSDHTRGLSSSWCRGPVFCSRTTALLFPSRFPGFQLSLLCVVDLGSWISLPLRSSGCTVVAQVMAIDAHHCPGSVMFLFRGEFGCFLYTGDFRWDSNTERTHEARSMILSALRDNAVDVLYLDNTYCNPIYEFPSRNLAAHQVVDIIASHPSHNVIIGIDSLGKEELLLHISRMLDVKIWVWPERLQTMHLLGLDDVFTTDTTLTRVRAVPRYSFSIDTLEGLNTMSPTIGIMPSGLRWAKKNVEGDAKLFGSLLTASYRRRERSQISMKQHDKPSGTSVSVHKFHKYIYSVQYSDHSCFEEIGEFIDLVKPHSMKGIVASSSCYIDPLYYFGRICRTNQPPRLLPLKPKSTEQHLQFQAVQTRSCSGSGKLDEVERKRQKNFIISFSGVKMKRARSIKRVICGGKISEIDSSD